MVLTERCSSSSLKAVSTHSVLVTGQLGADRLCQYHGDHLARVEKQASKMNQFNTRVKSMYATDDFSGEHTFGPTWRVTFLLGSILGAMGGERHQVSVGAYGVDKVHYSKRLACAQ